jgi:hypothetical protein
MHTVVFYNREELVRAVLEPPLLILPHQHLLTIAHTWLGGVLIDHEVTTHK